MSFADHRAEFLRNRVLTATPAQRVVMLYDRLALDLNLARSAEDAFAKGQALSHAMEIVTELQSSLDHSVGGPAENLAQLYGFVLRQLMEARGGALDVLDSIEDVVRPLRAAWAEAADIVAGGAGLPAGQSPSGSWRPLTTPAASSAWVG
ncbi:MAG: flagellar export chaperone FliS [Jatrophihabitans sp.]|uniref:flagellar export chaperone FliS n=1 Tax=Jatrophihabitans sp. TaxID=1932789 RepID=UPI003F7D2EF6